MKFSKNNLIEYITLYLNDLSDYGEDNEYELAESILSSFNNLEESEENLYETLKNTANTSLQHKQVITEFLGYINEFGGEHEIKNLNYFQQLLNTSQYSPSQRDFIQNVLNSIKKQNNLATNKQFDILQRLKTGDFNYGKK